MPKANQCRPSQLCLIFDGNVLREQQSCLFLSSPAVESLFCASNFAVKTARAFFPLVVSLISTTFNLQPKWKDIKYYH